MSLQDIPKIPGIDPAAVRSLTRLCGDEASSRRVTTKPWLVDLDDGTYVMFTDGSTAILIRMDDELPEEIVADDEVQGQFAQIIQNFSTNDYIQIAEDVDAEAILAWCAEGTEKCPKCEGKKTCMFPRHQSEAHKRENPDVLDAHQGLFGDALMDRRRLQIPLKMLEVTEGPVDVLVVSDPGDEQAGRPPNNGVLIQGEGWKIYTMGLTGTPDEGTLRFPID
jgi:hypothetical protein